MFAINILMIIFTALLFGVGIYLYLHRHQDFMIFKTTQNSLLSAVVKNFGMAFLISGFISIASLVFQNLIGICLALLIGCIVVTGFYLTIAKFIK